MDYASFLIFLGQKERKKKWDEKHQEAIAEAVKCLDEFDKVASFYFIGHKSFYMKCLKTSVIFY